MYIGSTGILPENVKGSVNGYSYELVQLLTQTKTFLYRMTNPTGISNIIELDAEAISTMVRDPETIWKASC